MEFANFFKILLRHKRVILIIPLITAIITYFLVKNLPETYRSTARLATGLVERSDDFISLRAQIQESKTSQEFSNIIQMMMLKSIINQVSYQLMINDLTAKGKPYRKPSKLLEELSDAERQQAANMLKNKYNKMEELSLWNDEQKKLHKLITSMKYDYESLTKKLNVYRLQTSDYIHMEYTSENPQLSAFVLNTLSKEFIKYYSAVINQNKDRAMRYLDSSLQAKQSTLNAKMDALKDYKIRNRVLDVNQQASVLMGQIAEFQTRRQEALKNISAYGGALRNIDSKLDPSERRYAESSVTQSNQDILVTRNRLNALNDEYIKSSFDPKYKPRIDSLQNALTNHINQANDRSTYNTSTAKQDLVKEKMNMEINLEIAKNSVASLNNEVNNLSGRLGVLAPNQANIQAFEKEIENESREYVELVNKYNAAKLESSFPIKLRQVEMAMPEAPEPSRHLLYVFLAGFISFLICVVVLFVMFYFDNTIHDATQLADRTQLPVIGFLKHLNGAVLNPEQVWGSESETGNMRDFTSQLRSIRFEINNDLGNSKVLAVTSLQPFEGKTFLSMNLAYAYKMINKKVLLIDGNFDNPILSQTVNPNFYLEDFLHSKYEVKDLINTGKNMIVMGNRGEDVSLLEIGNNAAIQLKMQLLKEQFDIILIEIPSLDVFNKAREWISFSEKVITVFEAGQDINKAKEKEITYLNNLNGKHIGWVINKIPGSRGINAERKGSAKKVFA